MLKMARKSQKGFTLIEIIVVLIILGVLAAISIPSYFEWIKRSDTTEALESIRNIKNQFVSCLRTHIGNEKDCFGSSAVCSLNECHEDIVVGGRFNYEKRNYFATCSSLGCFQHDNQGWWITAFRPLPDTSQRRFSLSGNGDDSQTACFVEKTVPPSVLWVPDYNC